MRTPPPSVDAQSFQILDLWLQWQLVSWKGLGLLCLPMFISGLASRWLWTTHALSNLAVALLIGFVLHGVTVGQLQSRLLQSWLGKFISWRHATAWGTILGAATAGFMCLVGLGISATFIVTLILMPLGLLLGLATPIISGGLGGYVMGHYQQPILSPHFSQAQQWPLWSGLGGLVAGLLGSLSGAMIHGLLSNVLAMARWTDGAADTAITLQGTAVGILVGWASFQAITGFAIARFFDMSQRHDRCAPSARDTESRKKP